jgi:hypothetical protein
MMLWFLVLIVDVSVGHLPVDPCLDVPIFVRVDMHPMPYVGR